MLAEKKPYYDANRKRLADIIPLPHPFTVYIEQTRYCNFKCFYCIHSTRDKKDGEFASLGYALRHMDFALYGNIIQQLAAFPHGIKRIVFSGLGEPLMNPRFPEIVRIARNANIAERVEVITNAVLLTPDLTDAIIDAGITNISVSIQGVNADRYQETCGMTVDFEALRNNLLYLYTHRGNAKIYVKIVDAALKGPDEEKAFFDLFGDRADRIYVEHLVLMQQQMQDLKKHVNEQKNFYNEAYDPNRQVCSQAFYFLQIGCDGDTFPCPNPGLPRSLSMGNLNTQSAVDVWNGPVRRKFLRTMLSLERKTIPECRDCTTFNCINNPLENLDDDAPHLVDRF